MVMAERRSQLGYPYVNPLEPTLAERLFHERITRKELGYDLLMIVSMEITIQESI